MNQDNVVIGEKKEGYYLEWTQRGGKDTKYWNFCFSTLPEVLERARKIFSEGQ